MGDIKEAFKRVKKDISSLNQEITSLKEEISSLHESLREIKQTTQHIQNPQNQTQLPLEQRNKPYSTQKKRFDNSTHPSTDRQKNSTDSTHPSTDNSGFKPLNDQNLRISTGNKGVSTDRQTHRQTHRQPDYTNFRQTNYHYRDHGNSQPEKRGLEENYPQEGQDLSSYHQSTTRQHNTEEQHSYLPTNKNFQKQNNLQKPELHSQPQNMSSQGPSPPQNNLSHINNPQNQEINQEQNTMNNALEILNSLDSIKKEIRFKFKKLTDQEMTVFSALYQLGEENEIANYKAVSRRLNLSESSIRDYVGRLMKKGIPIEKKRINNKTIHLKISEDLKKIATLPTILKLRDL